MLGRRFLAVGLGISVAIVAAMYTTASTGGRGDASATRAKTITSVVTSDLRIVLRAQTRGGGGGAPTATLTLTLSERVGGAWQRTGVHRLRGSYFWKTVTGPRAVCRLEIRTTGAQTAFRPRVVVQVLQSPSLGCGPASEYALTR